MRTKAVTHTLSRLTSGNISYSFPVDFYSSFVTKDQLKDRKLWAKFVEVYRTREDINDLGWRGEYYGKMMRGASLMYQYTHDEELYDVLSSVVRDLLSTQDKDGRISTYTVDQEFSGWDIWCRKYVLTGTLHFWRICKDESFKTEILSSLMRHADYIIERIGIGKKSILETSHWYGGLNSSSILEPFVDLYSVTHEKRYLDFAEYILNEGGCLGGNLLLLAEEDKLYPFQYPEIKAYEMMSFFEGALSFYEVTGEERYLSAVEKFTRRVAESDITVIGCAGCRNEKFDNARNTQSLEVEDGTIMQETCVTVTWMRLLERLVRVTGKGIYAEEFTKSALNAMLGSVNINKENQFSREEKKLLPGLTFDSYSPLTYQTRGIGIGGFKRFSDTEDYEYYGCCACIGAAGIALIPLESVMEKEKDHLTFNSYFSGRIEYEGTSIIVENSIYSKGYVKLFIENPECKEIYLDLLIPSWAKEPKASVDGKEERVGSGYHKIKLIGKKCHDVYLFLYPTLREERSRGKISYSFGDLTLARDEAKESVDIRAPFTPSDDYTPLPPMENELLRLRLNTKEGPVLLTDYQSCGKKWNGEKARISVWLNYNNT